MVFDGAQQSEGRFVRRCRAPQQYALIGFLLFAGEQKRKQFFRGLINGGCPAGIDEIAGGGNGAATVCAIDAPCGRNTRNCSIPLW